MPHAQNNKQIPNSDSHDVIEPCSINRFLNLEKTLIKVYINNFELTFSSMNSIPPHQINFSIPT